MAPFVPSFPFVPFFFFILPARLKLSVKTFTPDDVRYRVTVKIKAVKQTDQPTFAGTLLQERETSAVASGSQHNITGGKL
jgi:hypothetical protein